MNANVFIMLINLVKSRDGRQWSEKYDRRYFLSAIEKDTRVIGFSRIGAIRDTHSDIDLAREQYISSPY